MKNLKTKVAAGATILGLGGLAGLALNSNARQAEAPPKPKVRTKVIRRTIHVTRHVKPKHPAGAGAVQAASGPVATDTPTPEATPVITQTSTAGSAEGAPEPITTATSGAGMTGGGYAEDEGEYESEVEDD